MNDGYVSISLEEYAQLVEDQQWLSCLAQAGVDNWEGYDYARELWREYKDEEDDS